MDDSTKRKLEECNYREVINIYNLLSRRTFEMNAAITKIRLKYLYTEYSKASIKKRQIFVLRMQKILSKQFGIEISYGRIDSADKIIKKSKDYILDSNNIVLLGKILPVILTIEKELRSVKSMTNDDIDTQDTKDGYNIGPFALAYLRGYDERLEVSNDDYTEYDVFNAYCNIGKRRCKVKMCLFGMKIGALLDRIGETLWMKY